MNGRGFPILSLRMLLPTGAAAWFLFAATVALTASSPGVAIDCPPCDDNVACTIDACDTATGTCTHTTYSCEDGYECTINICAGQGACYPAFFNNRAECEDGNLCTRGTQCLQYDCIPGDHYQFIDCNDGNVCTIDSCNPAIGCVRTPASGPCDDGNACTGAGTCSGGACQPGAAVTCDDGNPCTNDSCDPAAGCRHANNIALCDDGRACTSDDRCSAGVCAGVGVCPCADLDQDGFAECSSSCDAGGLPCGDCDDRIAAVHPGAPERCNHIDDDCDGSVDEGSDKTWDHEALDDPGGSAGDRYGAAIARLGDVTGDGIDDLAIGAPTTDTPSGIDAGSVVIFSGADRSVHCRAVDPGGLAGDRLGTSLASLPDLTGDGVPDLVAGAPGSTPPNDLGRVAIISGADCAVVRSCTDSVMVQITTNVFLQSYRDLGTTVAYAGDQNGDGFPDILAGDPSAFNALPQFWTSTLNGRVAVFSGANCAVLRRLPSPDITDFMQFGSALANLGDLTGDGIDEYAVGMPGASSPGIQIIGKVLVYSGATGSLLRTMEDFEPEARGGHFGSAIGLLPDINDDGVWDLAVGEPDGDRGLVDSGYVVVLSGADGLVLSRCAAPDAQAGDRLGRALVIVPDLDGDGLPDIAASAPNDDVGPLTDAGSVAIFSSAGDCAMLTRLTDAPPGARSGARLGETGLALAGDLAGDPAADIVAGNGVDADQASGHAVVFHAESQCPALCDPDDPDNHPGNPETCDGRDNNCDGVADDGDPGGGLACATSQPGLCAAGTMHCLGGAIVCAPNVAAVPERCNGLDDDCDGSADNGDPGGGLGCESGRPGLCSQGTTHCVDAALLCAPNVEPGSEICNGLDDDCDGIVDEGDPGGGRDCVTEFPGVCAAGTTHCRDFATVCVPDSEGSTEVCDGLDNDCNGAADDIDQDFDGVPDCTDNCPVNPNYGQDDSDRDGVGDLCDNCATIPNPDQNSCVCQQCGIIVVVVDRAPQGGAIVRWITDVEIDLLGFNVVTYDKGQRIPLTPSLIPCQECASGQGASYAVPIAKHKNGRSLYVEQVSTSGVQTFGPAVKNW
jgi:hypothetical protein